MSVKFLAKMGSTVRLKCSNCLYAGGRVVLPWKHPRAAGSLNAQELMVTEEQFFEVMWALMIPWQSLPPEMCRSGVLFCVLHTYQQLLCANAG